MNHNKYLSPCKKVKNGDDRVRNKSPRQVMKGGKCAFNIYFEITSS